MKNLYKIEDELYIVSNTETISENCWIITSDRLVQVSYLLSDEVAKGFKVILTTNDLLIKNGVQAIDDEFLEWFVKNPSCEFVEVIPLRKSSGWYDKKEVWHWDFLAYKIIIPKEESKREFVGNTSKWNIEDFEEPKQDYSGVHLAHCYQGEYEDGCKYGEDDCPAKPLEEPKQTDEKGNPLTYWGGLEEPKQETLEEVAIRFYKESKLGNVTQSFIEGAKWEQERSYSEEEVLEILKDFRDNIPNDVYVVDWFEQFKKK